MSYIFGKLWHLAIIWAIRKAFQCIVQGVRFLLSNHTRLSPTSDNESYSYCYTLSGEKLVHCVSPSDWHFSPSRFSETEFLQVILLRHHRISWNKNMWPFCSFIQENFCRGFWAYIMESSWQILDYEFELLDCMQHGTWYVRWVSLTRAQTSKNSSFEMIKYGRGKLHNL